MANTFTQINIQLIFAVQGRNNLLKDTFREEVYKYIYGTLKKNSQYPLAVNGYYDHVHAFFELNPKTPVSDIAKITKANSSRWINEQNFTPGKFHWQYGYGAFSYSRSHRDKVIKYIMNQENHHRKKSFKTEYIALLEAFEVIYDESYLFEWFDLNNVNLR
jgi:REP element-mobilizing transposase RayT